ncbi:MAG TPA: DUF29 domain-containing protein [Acetobacteraceae bacterium]|jgi:hypothetical protein
MNQIKYDQDFHGWTQEQARLLRQRRFAELDIDNVVEEIQALGRGERREVVSHLRLLLTHLLNWQHQPGNRGRSWRLSIEGHRIQAAKHLEENPSLRSQLDDIQAHAYRLARIDAERQTRLSRKTFPESCPWSFDRAISDDFWPDDG